jgi:hypothetical protein
MLWDCVNPASNHPLQPTLIVSQPSRLMCIYGKKHITANRQNNHALVCAPFPADGPAAG